MNINDKNVNKYIPETNFHPSLFNYNDGRLNTDINSINNVINERNSIFGNEEINKLKSLGSYNLTINDEYKNKSNTNSLFKTLHGETLLTYLFFSDNNVINIQNNIKFLVHKYTNKLIDNQSKQELLIVMRSIYLEYFNQPLDYSNEMSNELKKKAIIQTQNEVARLNNLVINDVVPRIVSQLQGYLDYLRDASQPFGGNDFQHTKPISTNIRGQKDYRSITSVLLGGNF